MGSLHVFCIALAAKMKQKHKAEYFAPIIEVNKHLVCPKKYLKKLNKKEDRA